MTKNYTLFHAAFRGQPTIEDAEVCLRSGRSYRGRVSVLNVSGDIEREKPVNLGYKAIQVVLSEQSSPFVVIDLDAIESIVVHQSSKS